MASVAADQRATVRRPLLLLVGAAALVVALDQLTKWWVLEALTDPVRTIDLVWTLRLRVLYNTGTAFSLTSDSGPYVTVVALVVMVVLVRSGRQQRHPAVLVCYGAILGGTLGNLLDRAFRAGDGFLGGPVIDFVDLQWFPVFNVADAALVVGIAVLLALGWLTDAFDEEDATVTGEDAGADPADDPAGRSAP